MDRLAACHLMHGFIRMPNHRGRHPSSPNCQYVKRSHRSLSLADRRGLISPLKSDRRGITSSFRHQSHSRDEFEENHHSMKKFHDMNIVMQVMDFNRFSSENPIGDIALPNKNVKFDKNPVYCHNIQRAIVNKDYVGELMLTICYLPHLDKLAVNVFKARDLPNRDKLGNCDSYVNLWFLKKSEKVEKRKTSVRPQTSTPIYNESFTFDSLPSKEVLLNEVNLVLTVMDLDVSSNNEEIGHVIVGALGSDSGIRQWKDVIENAEIPSTIWHRLTPKWNYKLL